MLLNPVERLLMNNPARAWAQRRVEAPLLLRLGGRLDGMRVLEVGCGRGVGTRILFEEFGAAHVHAVDADPRMVALARRGLADIGDERLRVGVADAAALGLPDASYDAVVEFGVLHHVPEWRRAVAEVRRVLAPGGRFYFGEVTRQALDRWVYRTFLDHPTEDRFTADELVAELGRRGLEVADRRAARCYGDFVYGVAQREP